MRILFASMPADGHFNPLTGIAAHLTRHGHDVRWYAGPRYARKVEALGMRYFPYRRATEVTGANINSLFPERATLKGPKLISFDLEKFFVANVDDHFRDIPEIRDEFPFDVGGLRLTSADVYAFGARPLCWGGGPAHHLRNQRAFPF